LIDKPDFPNPEYHRIEDGYPAPVIARRFIAGRVWRRIMEMAARWDFEAPQTTIESDFKFVFFLPEGYPSARTIPCADIFFPS
jgi:hypothetical protein